MIILNFFESHLSGKFTVAPIIFNYLKNSTNWNLANLSQPKERYLIGQKSKCPASILLESLTNYLKLEESIKKFDIVLTDTPILKNSLDLLPQDEKCLNVIQSLHCRFTSVNILVDTLEKEDEFNNILKNFIKYDYQITNKEEDILNLTKKIYEEYSKLKGVMYAQSS